MNEQEYDAIKGTLPPFTVLDAEFDIASITELRKPMKEMTKKVFERLEPFRKILEGIVSPEAVVELTESQYITDDERLLATECLRRLMHLDRGLLLTELENTEAAYLAYITRAITEWTEMKPQLRALFARMQESWNETKALKQQLHYLG